MLDVAEPGPSLEAAFALELPDPLAEPDEAAMRMKRPMAAKMATTMTIGTHDLEDSGRDGTELDFALAGLEGVLGAAEEQNVE